MGKFQIGDAALKKYASGRFFDNAPMTKKDLQIYLLFVKGVSLKRVQNALANDNIIIDGQKLFDIVRKVGRNLQQKYKESVSVPFDKPKLLFAEFVRGKSIEDICQDDNIDAGTLFKLLRDTGKLYGAYQSR